MWSVLEVCAMILSIAWSRSLSRLDASPSPTLQLSKDSRIELLIPPIIASVIFLAGVGQCIVVVISFAHWADVGVGLLSHQESGGSVLHYSANSAAARSAPGMLESTVASPTEIEIEMEEGRVIGINFVDSSARVRPRVVTDVVLRRTQRATSRVQSQKIG